MTKVKLILCISLLLDSFAVIAIAVAVANVGGVAALISGFLPGRQRPPGVDAYYQSRVELLAGLPVHSSQIVMLGDSLTRNGEWQEFFPGLNVVNRGVGNDTAEGVLKRMPSCLTERPSKLFLLIGINDLQRRTDGVTAAKKVAPIVAGIHRIVPRTKVYLQTILPCRERIVPSNEIKAANEQLRKVAASEGATLIDLHRHFADNGDRPIGDLFIADGLHLSSRGYARWVEVIAPYLARP